jgi:hypothetical protein
MAIAAWGAAPAAASQGIETFTASPSTTQAGAHPDLTIAFSLDQGSSEAADDVTIEGATGLALLPPSIPTCPSSEFVQVECSSQTQVGVVTIHASHESNSEFLLGTAAIYARTPAAGQFAELGFWIPSLDLPVTVPVGIRSASDHGLRISLKGLPQSAPLQEGSLTLWGVPAAPAHDAERLPRGTAGCPGQSSAGCGLGPVASPLPQTPFVENSTDCFRPQLFGLTVTTYEDPEQPTSDSSSYSNTGCDQLSFDPSVATGLTTEQIHSKTGVEIELKVPQTQSVSFPSPSYLEAAEIAFTGGLRLDEEAAGAQLACSGAQVGFGTENPPTCPAGAKLGTVAFDGPAFREPLIGGIYFGGAEPDGGFVGAYLLASGSGVQMKQPMFFVSDPERETPVAVLPGLPPLPIAEIDLHFLPGEGSLLTTANRCGIYTVRSRLAPWDLELAEQIEQSTLALSASLGGGPCPGPAAGALVTLTPPTLFADGRSATTATAAVTDKDGIPVLEDDVRFSTSDPGQQVGPTIDNEDGTYTARIVASGAAGAATITATDLTVEPPVSGSATLTQLPVHPGGPGAGAAPETTFVKQPPKRSTKRRVTFTFTASVGESTFRCKLDARPYRPCTSPLKLTDLKPGRHRFSVFATSATGAAGKPAEYGFTISRKHRRP